jgi:hypothetical protein
VTERVLQRFCHVDPLSSRGDEVGERAVDGLGEREL